MQISLKALPISTKIIVLADLKIGAVFRSREYSPNHIGTDAAILNEVCDQLRKRGCNVETYSEERVADEGFDNLISQNFNAWLTMARSPRCVELMQRVEKAGVPVINSAFGIENCRRGRMSRLLAGHGIPMADYVAVDTDESILERLKKEGYSKCWVKQADYHSKHKEDVTFVRHAAEAQEVLQEYFMRGIKEAVVCRHQAGDLIRFYGVDGTGFFYWFMPMDDRHFAPDSNEGDTTGHQDIDVARLKKLCADAAETLELQIYGGDCILLPDGTLKIIDVNDWPSFAPCRRAAASYIARYVLKRLK